ncbi:hypothetical protein OG427_38895 [Streptomyces sp. NBC_00133]|uniref:hypothetical protein n=1 Tax=Streptomyces sp. NBC_00133 TaxID=2903624 RepID=UPI00324E5F92
MTAQSLEERWPLQRLRYIERTNEGGVRVSAEPNRGGVLMVGAIPLHTDTVGVVSVDSAIDVSDDGTAALCGYPSLAQDYELSAPVWAVHALYCAAQGLDEGVRFCAELPELWPGRRGHGERWRNAVSTAVIGTWAEPLNTGGSIGPADLDRLRAETRATHRQLTPMWHRKVHGDRLWSLDFEFGEGLTSYDVLCCGLDPFEVVSGTMHDDPRINAALAQLSPAMRAVATAYGDTRSMLTWTEAAVRAAELAPELFREIKDLKRFGDKARSRLSYLGKEHRKRAQKGIPVPRAGQRR